MPTLDDKTPARTGSLVPVSLCALLCAGALAGCAGGQRREVIPVEWSTRGQELVLLLPPDFKRAEHEWLEGVIYTFARDAGPCAASLQVDFYGGFGAGLCGPQQIAAEPGTFAERPVTWSSGAIDDPTCGHRLWRRALFVDGGGITLVARSEKEMATLRDLAGAARLSRAAAAPHQEPKERWQISPAACALPPR